eukprot:6802942-Pyramimonas_sp.AAC.1
MLLKGGTDRRRDWMIYVGQEPIGGGTRGYTCQVFREHSSDHDNEHAKVKDMLMLKRNTQLRAPPGSVNGWERLVHLRGVD